jgi:hypothetical protein
LKPGLDLATLTVLVVRTAFSSLDTSLTTFILTSPANGCIITFQSGAASPSRGKKMRIGDFVQKRGAKDSMGIITERPPISYCWTVKWTRGDKRGKITIMQEDNLVKAQVR